MYRFQVTIISLFALPLAVSPLFYYYVYVPTRDALVLKVKGALGLRPQCNYHNTL